MNKKFVVVLVAFFAICLAIALFVRSAHCEVHHLEKYYQTDVCAKLGGQMEVVTSTDTRCDCLTPDYAIEFDFAHKYAESVGQSLDYSAHLNRTPGIVLIMEKPTDQHFADELLYLIKAKNLGIKVWTAFPNGVVDVDFKEVN